MGFLSNITGGSGKGFNADILGVFGDQGRGAAAAQSAENLAQREFTAKLAELARADVLPLFQSAQDARGGANQAALDVFGGAIPQQLQTFQGGNVGAQEALLGGQTNFQRAILGLPLQQQQAQTIGFDTSFIPSQLPAVDALPIAQRGILPQLTAANINAAFSGSDERNKSTGKLFKSAIDPLTGGLLSGKKVVSKIGKVFGF
jgi:hypothetical protein